jgi:hypothetical protein
MVSLILIVYLSQQITNTSINHLAQNGSIQTFVARACSGMTDNGKWAFLSLLVFRKALVFHKFDKL